MVKGNFKKIIVSVGLTSLLIGTSITSVNAAVQPQRIAVFQAHFQGLLKKSPIPGSKELSPAELQCLNDGIYGVKNGNDRIDGSKVWDYVVGSRYGKNPTPPKDGRGKAPLSCNLPQLQAQPPMNAPAPAPTPAPAPMHEPMPPVQENAPTPAPAPMHEPMPPVQENAPAPAPAPMHEPMPPVQENAPAVQPAFPKGPTGSGSSMGSSIGSNGSFGPGSSEFQPTPEQGQGEQGAPQYNPSPEQGQEVAQYNPTPEQKKQDEAFKEKIHQKDFKESFDFLNDVQDRYSDLMEGFAKRYLLPPPAVSMKNEFDAASKKLFENYYNLLKENDKQAIEQLVVAIKENSEIARQIALKDMKPLIENTNPIDKNAPAAIDIKDFVADLKKSDQPIPVKLDILSDFLATKGYEDSKAAIGYHLLERSGDYLNPNKANINNCPQLIKNLVALRDNPLRQQMKNIMDRRFTEGGTAEFTIKTVKDLVANAPDAMVKETVQKVKDKTLNKIIREHSKKSFDRFKELMNKAN